MKALDATMWGARSAQRGWGRGGARGQGRREACETSPGMAWQPHTDASLLADRCWTTPNPLAHAAQCPDPAQPRAPAPTRVRVVKQRELQVGKRALGVVLEVAGHCRCCIDHVGDAALAQGLEVARSAGAADVEPGGHAARHAVFVAARACGGDGGKRHCLCGRVCVGVLLRAERGADG